MKIKLTQKQFAIIDDIDFDQINQVKWYAYWNNNTKSYYAVRGKWTGKRGFTIYMARQIMGLKKGDKRQVHHINHDTLDNRGCNLKIVTASENNRNQRGVKGCCWHKQKNKWIVNLHIGSYNTEKEARAAYIKARKMVNLPDLY